MTDAGRTCWFTGSYADCSCGHPCQVFTDGDCKFAHCYDCGKTWDVDTQKEVEKP